MPIVTITDNSTGGTHSGTEDVWLKESAATTNQDAVDGLEVHAFGSSNRANGLIRFTLPAVLTGATINSATLSLKVKDKTVTYTVDVHRCLQAWTETGATWNKYDGTTDWATAGGTGGADMTASATASVSVAASVNFYQDFAGLTADVQAWASGAANHGWLLKRNNYTAYDSHYIVFSRSEGTDGNRPILVVDYTAGASNNIRAASNYYRMMRSA